jgi:hypothetical protein
VNEAMRLLEAGGVVAPPVSSNGHGVGVELVRASSLTVTRPTYTWKPRWPNNGVTLLAGLEGLGKTVIAVDRMARLTRGQLEGDRYGRPGDVVYVGIEDDWESQALPRLIAAGADLDRVHFVRLKQGGIFSVEADLGTLTKALASLDEIAAIVVDPLDAHLGEVDSHRKSEVQRSIQHLAELSQLYRCGLLGIGHLNKNELSRDVLMRIIGSKGFTTSARSVLAVGDHPTNDGEWLLVLRKSNFVDRRTVPALRYRIEGREIDHPEDGGTIKTQGVAWLGEEADIDADSILMAPNLEERTERDEAAEWLTDLLADGRPCPYKEVERLASEAGIARATLHRARPLAKVVVERDANAQGRPSTWRLEGPVITRDNRDPLSSQPEAGFSSQSQTQHSETKDETPLSRENDAGFGLSSHVSELRSDETEPLDEASHDEAIAAATSLLGAEPAASQGRCQFCQQESVGLEDLGRLGKACEDCAEQWRPEMQKWAAWNASQFEEISP